MVDAKFRRPLCYLLGAELVVCKASLLIRAVMEKAVRSYSTVFSLLPLGAAFLLRLSPLVPT